MLPHAVCLCAACSKLWGCKGELSDLPTSLGAQRLLDWSYAGYMAGEMPIPKLPLVGSVMDFGAVGDGVADDSKVCQGFRPWRLKRCAVTRRMLGSDAAKQVVLHSVLFVETYRCAVAGLQFPSCSVC